ncbi:PAS domain-containing protein [bacterium]|nr:PAS domain-containing protein [bacterium]
MSEPFNISDSTRQLLQQRAQEEGCSVDTLLTRWLSIAPTTESIPYSYFDALPSEVVIVDVTQPHQPVTYVNRAFEQVTGYTLAEIQGRNLRFLQGHDDDQPGRAVLREAIQNGQSTMALLRNYHKDGTLFWTEVSIAPIRNSHGQITLTSVRSRT